MPSFCLGWHNSHLQFVAHCPENKSLNLYVKAHTTDAGLRRDTLYQRQRQVSVAEKITSTTREKGPALLPVKPVSKVSLPLWWCLKPWQIFPHYLQMNAISFLVLKLELWEEGKHTGEENWRWSSIFREMSFGGTATRELFLRRRLLRHFAIQIRSSSCFASIIHWRQ